MTNWKRLCSGVAMALAALCLAPRAFATPRRHKAKAPRTSAAAKKKAPRKTRAAHTRKTRTRKVSTRKGARHKSNLHFRLAHMQPSAERVAEIQEALIQAGDLQGPANGKWDSATRDAMAHYQETNGFAVTGLPDSKSLMKMGLGPHPLPADVVSNTEKSTAAPDTPPGIPSPADKPSDPGPSKGGGAN